MKINEVEAAVGVTKKNIRTAKEEQGVSFVNIEQTDRKGRRRCLS